MKQIIATLLVVLLAISIFSMATITGNYADAKQTKADKKAEKAAHNALDKFIGKGKHFDNLCTLSATTKMNSSNQQFYQKDCIPIPPPVPVNKAPQARITTVAKANVGDNVTLDGTGSFDPDGTIVSYLWSGVQTTNNSAKTTFVFPNVTQVTATLVVTDNNGSTGSVSVAIPNAVQPPPTPVPCKVGEHKENGICVPDVIPPKPNGEVTKVCLVGDYKDGSVVNKMNGCDVKVSLGDSGYGSNLNLLKSLGFTKCDIGNHDAEEDGSSSIYQEALAYCGDHWSLETANGTTLIIGLNTNGDINTQVNFVKSLPLSKYKTVIFTSHKGGHVPPNSHHVAEAKGLYSQIEVLIPTGVKLIEVYGHNHVSSAAPSNNWYQAGGGGKSHYSCGTDNIWTFCDNSKYGYLEITINNSDGTNTAKFIN